MNERIYSALFLLCTLNGIACVHVHYSFSDLKFFALLPKGLRVEIPDEPGLELFSFQGKLNDIIAVSDDGDIVGVVNSPTNGKWIFEEPDLELRVGDKIHYWVYVQYKRAGYYKSNQMWEVTELGVGSCNRSSTTVADTNKQICSGSIIFEDDFNGLALDTDKWTVEKYIPSVTDDDHYEFVSYQNRSENRFLRNSVLHLKPTAAASRADVFGQLNLTSGCIGSKQESCSHRQVGGYILPPVVSAKILSKVSFKYGKVEIKAKLPLGDWIYPQIELIPKNKLPPYPKIVIAYARGNLNLTLNNNEDIGNTLLFGGPIESPQEPQRSRNLRSWRSKPALGRTMRTYTLTWSPARIDLLIDNQMYGTVYPHEYVAFDSELQLALGVGVGGNYDFPDGVRSGVYEKPWRNFDPSTMKQFFDKKNYWISTWVGDDVDLQIDSVKVWAL